MGTSKKSTGETLFDLTSYAAVILANLSVRLENGEVKKTRATCGRGYETPLATYNPNTQSWRMSEGICPLVGHLSLANLPPSGMTRNGVLFPQPPWEPITDATESSSWPTPTTQDHIERKSTQQKPGSRHSVGLGDAVRMWPTPTTQETEHPDAELTETGRRKSKDGTTSHSLGLADAVRMWPTPTANDSKNATFPESQRKREGLIGHLMREMWPTPTAVTRPMEGNVRIYRQKIEAGEMTEEEAEAILGKSVWEAQGKVPAKWPTPTHGKLAGGQGAFNRVQELYSEGTISDEERKAMQAGNGGKLNPMWVEWLMGFPLGWTDLED